MVVPSNYSKEKMTYARLWLDHEHHFYTPLFIAAAGALAGIVSTILALME